MKRHAWALLATTLFLAIPLAQAGSTEKPKRLSTEKFDALDTNHDGAISREEAAAAPELSGRFDDVDANHDGRVVPGELKDYARLHRNKKPKGAGGGPEASFETLDANHDGVLTRDEAAINPKMAKRFDSLDADRDGRVTAEEAKAGKGMGK